MKKSLSSLSRKLFLAFFLALFLMASAQAYLDPAATSYIIQVISGVVDCLRCGRGYILEKRFVCFPENQDEEPAAQNCEKREQGQPVNRRPCHSSAKVFFPPIFNGT